MSHATPTTTADSSTSRIFFSSTTLVSIPYRPTSANFDFYREIFSCSATIRFKITILKEKKETINISTTNNKKMITFETSRIGFLSTQHPSQRYDNVDPSIDVMSHESSTTISMLYSRA
jgi:hypothetical protein